MEVYVNDVHKFCVASYVGQKIYLNNFTKNFRISNTIFEFEENFKFLNFYFYNYLRHLQSKPSKYKNMLNHFFSA
jgi:hypothetical protein